MTATWSPDELQRIGSAQELEIAVKRADGTVRRWVSIGSCASAIRCTCGPGTGGRPAGSVTSSTRARPVSASRVWRPTSPSPTSAKDLLS